MLIYMYYTLLNICNAFYIKINIEKMKMQRPSYSQEFFQSCILFLNFQIHMCIKKKKKKSPVILSTLHSKYFSFKYIFGNK